MHCFISCENFPEMSPKSYILFELGKIIMYSFIFGQKNIKVTKNVHFCLNRI